MSEVRASRHLWRSVGALLAGFVAGALLSVGTDEVLHLTHFFPPWGDPVGDGPLAAATAYRIVYGVLASYIIARLAPYSPMGHALVGGVAGLVVSTAGAVATWNAGPAYANHWYPVALIITALPCAWLGGKLRLMQLRAPAARNMAV